jgi:membrane-bound serine protease (ClpP class)
MEGLAANWEILMFIIGIALLVVEIFVIPGFGIAGISGIVLVLGGLVLSLLNNVDFDFQPVGTGRMGRALFTVTAGISLGFGLVLYLSSRIGAKGIFHKIALNTNLETKEGYIGVSIENKELVGKIAITHTNLRPSGKINVDGNVLDAVSEGGIFIPAGTQVEIVRFEMGQLYVSMHQ